MKVKKLKELVDAVVESFGLDVEVLVGGMPIEGITINIDIAGGSPTVDLAPKKELGIRTMDAYVFEPLKEGKR